MTKRFLMILVMVSWCSVSFAELIEFKKCWLKEYNSTQSLMGKPLVFESWDDWNKQTGLDAEWGGVKGSDIPYENVVFTIDTANGTVIKSTIHTDEYLKGMNITLNESVNQSLKKWKEGGRKGTMPTAKYLTKIEKERYRLLEYSAGHISFDDPETAEMFAATGQTVIFDLNISEATIYYSHRSYLDVISKLYQCDESYDSGSGTETASSSGTAFFINKKGNLLTNNHVVEGCKSQKINYFNKEYEAKIIATDKTLDLALLKAEVKPNSFISFSKKEPKKRQNITVAGYPLGKYLSDDLKINDGKISALKGFDNNSNEIQHDIPINPGNSGGPIVNENGELVAVAVSGMAKDITEGLNFGIKSSAVENFLTSNQININVGEMKFTMSIDKVNKLLEESTVYTFCN